MPPESDEPPIDCFVRGSLLPGYEGYCPITQAYAYKQPDGTYLAWHPPVTLNESDLIDRPGFLVIHLGSIDKDYTVETAATALYNGLKSLFAACSVPVDFDRIRTTVELSEYMKLYRDNYSHLILIGHGTPNGIEFLDKPRPIGGSELAGLLGSDASQKSLQIISLCCHSGCASLARQLSLSPYITEVLAPSREFDMRWAVHFVTGFFLYMYIDNLDVSDALLHSARNSGNAPMCVWKQGNLLTQSETDQNR